MTRKPDYVFNQWAFGVLALDKIGHELSAHQWRWHNKRIPRHAVVYRIRVYMKAKPACQ